MSTKVEIKSRLTEEILFSAAVNQPIRLALTAALESAVTSGADLSGADLSGAYLRGADLSGADLSGADLTGAYLLGADLSGARLSGDDLKPTLVGDRPYLSIGPIGSEHGTLDVYLTDAGVYLRRGCWFGSIDEFEAAVTDKHGSNDHGQEYRAAIEMARAHATIWNPATEGAA